MVKKFLEIHIKDGKPDTSVNRKIFEDTEIITEPKYKKTVEDHMGQHPVIFIDFKGGRIKSEKLHPFSKKINETRQSTCEKWCNDELYKTMDVDDIQDSLYNLANYLYNHFGKRNEHKVYLLVDEFDAVCTNALFGLKKEDDKEDILHDINSLINNMVSNLTKGDNECFGGALVTGISYISGMGLCNLLNNFYKIRFLNAGKISDEDNGCVAFYGASEEEVESLVDKLVKRKHLRNFEDKPMYMRQDGNLNIDRIMETIKFYYNGYFDSKGHRVYSLLSLLQFLNSGDTKYYWKQTDDISSLYMILRNGEIAKDILKLLDGESIIFNYIEKLEICEILILYSLIWSEQPTKANRHVVFTFLVDLGFLCIVEKDTETKKFKIPNLEIRGCLQDMMHTCVIECWGISDIHMKECASAIDEISSSVLENEETLKAKMLMVHRKVAEMLKGFKSRANLDVNEVAMTSVMYTPLLKLEQFETSAPDAKIKNETKKSISSGRPDLLLRHIKEGFDILFEFKHDKKKDLPQKKTSVHALLEAFGKKHTTHGTTKDYIEALEQLGRCKVLVVGLSLNGECETWLSYAMKDKTFERTKGERTFFSISTMAKYMRCKQSSFRSC